MRYDSSEVDDRDPWEAATDSARAEHRTIWTGYEPPTGADERRRPLPPFLLLPVRAWSSLSRTGRLVAAALLTALAAAVALTLPGALETGRTVRDTQRRDAAANLESIRRTLVADQRPRRHRLTARERGRLRRGGGASTAAGRGLVATAIAASVLADATARARAGTLPQRPERARCEPIRSGPPRPGTTLFSCLAETPVSGSYQGRRMLKGYRFRARFEAGAGTFAWCKENPRPLHADQEEFVVVALSRACTG